MATSPLAVSPDPLLCHQIPYYGHQSLAVSPDPLLYYRSLTMLPDPLLCYQIPHYGHANSFLCQFELVNKIFTFQFTSTTTLCKATQSLFPVSRLGHVYKNLPVGTLMVSSRRSREFKYNLIRSMKMSLWKHGHATLVLGVSRVLLCDTNLVIAGYDNNYYQQYLIILPTMPTWPDSQDEKSGIINFVWPKTFYY